MKLKQRTYLAIVTVLVAIAALNADLIAQSGRIITTTGVSYVRYFSGWFGIVNNSIGTTSTRGLSIDNNTPAAAGAQQYSPMMCQEGQGWKTDATAGSQSVEFCWEVQPVQGSAAPTGDYLLKASINGGAFSTVGTFTSVGTLNLVTNITAGGSLRLGGQAVITPISDGVFRLGNSDASNTALITLADWGTTTSAESVSVAIDGTLFFGTAPVGTLFVTDVTGNTTGQFAIVGTRNATAEIYDSNGLFSVTKDTAASLNVYYDAAGASGAGYYLQNKRGAINAVRLTLIGG